MLQSGNKMESSKMEPKKKDKKEKPKYINVNNSGKSASYSTLSILCDLHKWVISSKSKLCLWCPNKLILFCQIIFGQTQRCTQNPVKRLRWSVL